MIQYYKICMWTPQKTSVSCSIVFLLSTLLGGPVTVINFLCEIFKLVLNCTYIHVLYFYDLFHILLSSDSFMDPRNVINMYVCMYVREEVGNKNLLITLGEKHLQWFCHLRDRTRILRRTLKLKFKGKWPMGWPRTWWFWSFIYSYKTEIMFEEKQAVCLVPILTTITSVQAFWNWSVILSWLVSFMSNSVLYKSSIRHAVTSHLISPH
jgi:hypothetical protein